MGSRWRARTWAVAAGVVATAVVVAGCGSSTSAPVVSPHGDRPANVTVRHSLAMPARLPANLVAESGRLADLVDFHDEDFSGTWFDPTDASVHVGVATPAGRALLDRTGMTHDSDVVVQDADRSLAEGQRFAERYVRRSALGDAIVGWATLPPGDGIDLFVHGDRLTSDQLAELGRLHMRVVVTLGQNVGTPD